MKKCCKCNVERPFSEYYLRSGGEKGYRSVCKPCSKLISRDKYKKNKQQRQSWNREYYKNNKQETDIRNKQNRLNLKDGYYYVYMVPDKNFYVGQTDSMDWRKYFHKSEMWELHKCKTREEALALESIYHQIGFPG